MRIAHFSDIHVGLVPRSFSSFLDKRILGAGNYLLRRRGMFNMAYVTKALTRIRALTPDWVICTGDLTSIGSPEEFAEARSLLQPYLDVFGERFLWVPGNHDAYVANRHCRAALQTTLQKLNSGRFHLDRPPLAVDAPGVRFILVNEAVPTHCYLSSGLINGSDVARLAAIVEEPVPAGTKRVLVGHFPLRGRQGTPLQRRRRLVGADPLYTSLCAGKLDVSLCGHDHTAFVRRETNGSFEVCAGSLTANGLINVLDINRVSGRVKQFWIDIADDGRPLTTGPDFHAVPAVDAGIGP